MKKIKTLLFVAMLSMMALAFNSCENNRYYYGSVVGVWQLDSDERGQVREVDIDKYRFNSDGTGVYGYYDTYGRWVSDVPFEWYYGWDGDGTITIDFGGNNGYYKYYYEVNGGELTISSDPYFRTYYVYVRVVD